MDPPAELSVEFREDILQHRGGIAEPEGVEGGVGRYFPGRGLQEAVHPDIGRIGKLISDYEVEAFRRLVPCAFKVKSPQRNAAKGGFIGREGGEEADVRFCGGGQEG